MNIHKFDTSLETGKAAAQAVSRIISDALEKKPEVNIILATGASQFTMLENLVKMPLSWSRVHAFHLDEYIGLHETHPASFRAYLYERFVAKLPEPVHFYPVNGSSPDPLSECGRLNRLIASRQIDVACIGIGENGHLAFNDPPADFDTDDPYIVVNLDEDCRKQQLGEGWFATLNDVPQQAISMSIRQILKSVRIVCTVPDLRKATAVQRALEGPVSNLLPASILQNHPGCDMFLDRDSASLVRT